MIARATSAPGVHSAGVVIAAVALSIGAHGAALFSVRDALREPAPATPRETIFELVDVPPPAPAPVIDDLLVPDTPQPGAPLAGTTVEGTAGPAAGPEAERVRPTERVPRPQPSVAAQPSATPSPPGPTEKPGPRPPERVDLTGLELPREGSGWAVPQGTTSPRSGTVDPTLPVRKTDKRAPGDDHTTGTTTNTGSGTGTGTGTGTGAGTSPDVGDSKRVAAHIPTKDAVIVKPKRTKHIKPVYPETLKAQGIEGNVRVRVAIDTEGRVTKAEVIEGSGHADFDEAARKAALSDRYAPATRDGEPVGTSISFTYFFRIEEG